MGTKLLLHSSEWPRLPGSAAYDPAVAHPAFLHMLEQEGTILDACRKLAIDRATVGTWRKKDPAFNRKVVEARKCYTEKVGNLLERHAIDVALHGAPNQFFDPASGEARVLRRHDGKILQSALQQFAGWGATEQTAAFAKEYILVGAEGETYSLQNLLKTFFAPQLREVKVEASEDGQAVAHDHDHH